MSILTVDRDRCIGDGLCLRPCSRDLITLDEDNMPVIGRENEARCTRCGHCVAVCPMGALKLEVPGGETVPLRDSLGVSVEQADQLLRSCRSVRRYRRDAVSEGEIADILETVRLAPTASNLQPVGYLVLRDRKAVQGAGDIVIEWFDKVARNTPKYASRYNVDEMIARYRNGRDPIMRHAPCGIIAYTSKASDWGLTDSAIGLTYFALAAHARGIGSCWLGYLMRVAGQYAPMREYLGIDDEHALQGMLIFGYQDVEYHAVPARKPVKLRWM